MLLLLAKSAVYTQKICIYPPHTLVFLEEYVCKCMLSIRIRPFLGELRLKKLLLLLQQGPMRMYQKRILEI